MDAMRTFAMSDLNKKKELKVFDWDKAATILKEEKAKYASAGLSGDWGWTGGKYRACCTAVFSCRVCLDEFIAKFEAPEME